MEGLRSRRQGCVRRSGRVDTPDRVEHCPPRHLHGEPHPGRREEGCDGVYVRRGGAQRSPVCALRRRDHWYFEGHSDLFRRVPIARRPRILRDARAVGAPLPVVRSASYP